jgi:hypothetical protein
MTNLVVAVGKKYGTRSGASITIISELEKDTGPYKLGYRFVGGPCGQYYTAEGKTYFDEDENPGDLILDLSLREHLIMQRMQESKGFSQGKYPPFFTEMNEGMCRIALAGEAGYDIDKADVEQDCSVLAKHAVTVIQAAFAIGRSSGLAEAKLALAPFSKEDQRDIFIQLQDALKKAVENGTVPTAEFVLQYDGEKSHEWSAMADNRNPSATTLAQIGGKIETPIFDTAEEAIKSMMDYLLR